MGDNSAKTPLREQILQSDIERLRGERDHYRTIAQAVQNNPAEDNKAYIKGFQDGFREGAKFASEKG